SRSLLRASAEPAAKSPHKANASESARCGSALATTGFEGVVHIGKQLQDFAVEVATQAGSPQYRARLRDLCLGCCLQSLVFWMNHQVAGGYVYLLDRNRRLALHFHLSFQLHQRTV